MGRSWRWYGLVGLTGCTVLATAGCTLLIDTDVGVGKPDGGGGGECGTTAALRDDFEASALSPRWIASHDGPSVGDPAPVGGELQFPVAAGEPTVSGQFSAAVSHFAYDMRGHSVTVRADPVDAAWDSNLEIRKPIDFDLPIGIRDPVIALGMGHDTDQMVAWTYDDGAVHPVRTAPYDPADHLYWRVRESGGEVEFEVAGADREFVPFTSLTETEFPLDSVVIALSVFANDPGDDGFLAYDDLNVDSPATPACPISQLSDSFLTAELSRIWIDGSDYCPLTTGDGTVSGSAEMYSNCVLSSAAGYSMVDGGAVTIEIPQLPVADDATVFVRLIQDPGDFIEVSQRADQLTVALTAGGAVVAQPTFTNPKAAQWWRLQERDGAIDVSTSTDGERFDLRHTLDLLDEIDLSALRVELAMRTADMPTTVTFGPVDTRTP